MLGTTRFTVLAALLLLSAAPASADEAFTPSNEQIDEDLDRALEQEYQGAAEAPPPPPPPPDYAGEATRERRGLEVRLGLMAAYFHAFLNDVKISRVDDGQGGGDIEFARFDAGDDSPGFEFDGEGTGTYRAWLDLGKYISLTAGARYARFEDTRTLSAAPGGTPGFDYGATTFQTGDQLRAEFAILITDYDVVFKPLNNKWVTMELSLGGRYVQWNTELTGESGHEKDRLEAVLPMVGFGLTLRPIQELSLFGRARVGHLKLEYEDDEDSVTVGEKTEREHTSLEADVGLSLIFEETFGFIAGYRFDYIELSRQKGNDSEGVEGVVHGLYGGLIVQF